MGKWDTDIQLQRTYIQTGTTIWPVNKMYTVWSLEANAT
jgi:hypothetical protein